MPGSGKIIALGGGSGTVGVGGSGSLSTNKIPKASAATTLVDSSITDNGTNVTFTEAILEAAGANTAPAYSFSSDTVTGVYSRGAGTWTVSVNQTPRFDLQAAKATYSQIPIGWASSNDASGATDTAISRVSGGTVGIGTGANGNTGGNLQLTKITKYNAVTTVSGGVPSELATVDLTTQAAAITATTLYAVPAAGAGMYRVSFVAKVTQAATTSCVLGGTNGFQVTYTDNDDSVVVTTPASVTFNATSTSLAVNTTQNQYSGSIIVNAKASTNIQYAIDYTSVGGTAMQYNLHIKLESL